MTSIACHKHVGLKRVRSFFQPLSETILRPTLVLCPDESWLQQTLQMYAGAWFLDPDSPPHAQRHQVQKWLNQAGFNQPATLLCVTPEQFFAQPVQQAFQQKTSFKVVIQAAHGLLPGLGQSQAYAQAYGRVSESLQRLFSSNPIASVDFDLLWPFGLPLTGLQLFGQPAEAFVAEPFAASFSEFFVHRLTCSVWAHKTWTDYGKYKHLKQVLQHSQTAEILLLTDPQANQSLLKRLRADGLMPEGSADRTHNHQAQQIYVADYATALRVLMTEMDELKTAPQKIKTPATKTLVFWGFPPAGLLDVWPILGLADCVKQLVFLYTPEDTLHAHQQAQKTQQLKRQVDRTHALPLTKAVMTLRHWLDSQPTDLKAMLLADLPEHAPLGWPDVASLNLSPWQRWAPVFEGFLALFG